MLIGIPPHLKSRELELGERRIILHLAIDKLEVEMGKRKRHEKRLTLEASSRRHRHPSLYSILDGKLFTQLLLLNSLTSHTTILVWLGTGFILESHDAIAIHILQCCLSCLCPGSKIKERVRGKHTEHLGVK